jgi:CHAT domain-containing protein/tetratricopeptide (TPR) repeat protein
MTAAIDKKISTPFLPELMRLESDSERIAFLSLHPNLITRQVVEEVSALVITKMRIDPREALRLAEAVVLIADRLSRTDSKALALRTKANALYACGDNRAAVRYFEQAYEMYASANDLKEAARTLSHSIHPLILSGEYDRAFAAAQKAQTLFTELGDHKRLASLENNFGNILHRQDRFEEALAHYESSYQALAKYEAWEHAAIALSNMAMCLISLNDFPRSLDCYQKARELCVKYGMPRLRDQADYNIAYLYYLRGQYSRAIDMLVATRRACEANGDAYHVALCYLDLSDIYLELNLTQEARESAHEGFLRFQKLGMGYEAAKTLANEAIAYGRQGETPHALKLLAKARKVFAREKNAVWPYLLDLYQALLLFREQRYPEARRLAQGAANFFEQAMLPGKAVVAYLLLARIALQFQDVAAAAKESESALAKVAAVEAPVLIYETNLLIAQTALRRGDKPAAYAALQEARRNLETIRTRLQREELKISFVRNRLEVYEALVALHFDNDSPQVPAEEAFGYVEAAKSRSMTETLFQTRKNLPVNAGDSKQVQQIRDLRAELNWYYHRIELEQLRLEGTSRELIERLKEEARSRERRLTQTLRELPVQERESADFDTPVEFSLKDLQAAIPADTALVEYYSTGDRLIAAVVTPESIRIEPLTQFAQVSESLHLLRFQLSKFRAGPVFTQPFQEILLRTTNAHLEDLYRQVIEPLRGGLKAKHLVLVPHGPMHFLPFHALRNGDEYLGDTYTVSYAPSATLFALCQQRVATAKYSSLVLGLPDERAPHIGTEAESVARLLPQSELYLGESATSEILRKKGAEIGFLHIATHGIYRQDNPMFSAIRLGDGYLNLYDLYQLRLSAKLVTLSGCATGMNFVAAGDELLGLQRGLFYAGATSLLLSLWDVHDRTTAELMEEFYSRYIETGDMAGSLQAAMRSLRRENPHPYYWAPFVVVGKIEKGLRPQLTSNATQ